MKQLITWTPLPNGIGTATGGTAPVLKLSVRVSPRLTPDGGETPLAGFADFIDWTGKGWSFSVLLGDYVTSGPTVPTATGLKPVNTLFPALWAKLFQGTPGVVVRDRTTKDFSNPVVRSFPAARVLDFIRQQYTAVALESPTDLPTPGWLYGRKGEVVAGNSLPRGTADFSLLDLGDRAERKAQLDGLMVNGVVPPTYPSSVSEREAVKFDFFQAEYFHAPKGGAYGIAPVRPDLDFHQVIAMLGDYPELMRALGLIFDIEVPIPAGMEGVDERIVRIWPENKLQDGADAKVALATCYDYNAAAGLFSARAEGGLITNGHLDISGPEFSVAQVDIDGSAIKAIGFTQTLGDLGIKKPAVLGTPRTAGLPALRSGGMSVLMTGRAAEFVTKLKNGTGYETQLADPVTRDGIKFSAEDLARGYRIDIFDQEKGEWFSLCQRQGDYSHAGDPAGTFILPQGLRDEGTVTVPGISSSDPAGSTDLYLHEALFHWDGWSLVVGLPGQTIKKPVKDAVDNNVGYEPSDMANAIGLTTTFTVPPGTLPRLRFGRHYRLRARIVDIAGNSRHFETDLDTSGATAAIPYLRFEPVASPVMMSDPLLRPGESVDRIVIRSWAGHETTATEETSSRRVLPPRTSVQLAEQHGMIDGPAPNGATSWYAELKKRDAAQIDQFVDPGEEIAEVPYLPDPIARGATLVGLPGADAPLAFSVDFAGKAWPAAGTFKLVLQEGAAGYEWREAERLLLVSLPKAERATVRMSCSLPDVATLEKLGLWHWIREAAPAPWLGKLAKIATDGRHWMITPYREITLVHAVQNPLAAPRLQGASPFRNAGETFCILKGLLHVHGKSTDKVDFRAAWEDFEAAPAAAEGFIRLQRAVDACRFNVSDPETLLTAMAERHELGDTRHRRISYWATAASRFREYFEDDADPTLPKDLTFTTPATLDRPADFVLDVPSSARPLAPRIEYIIPTFGWEEERTDDGVSRCRSGNSLRVYMSGDWFSSGEGELLGVLLAHGPQIVTTNGLTDEEGMALVSPRAPVPPEKLQPFVTRWGIDPIWLSGLVHQTPTLHHFPAAVARATDLVLEENPPIPADEPRWGVAVAGHPVAYDCERKLWYCDIAIDAGPSYYPFVRLALARYQPCSVAGTELSRVFTADCVQTAPDRLVWVSPDPNNPAGVRVSLSGVAPRGCFNVICPNRVIVRAEVMMPGTEAPVWVPVAGPWVPLAEMQVSKTVTVWSGGITLPQVRDAQRYRLVVEEYEFLNADPGRGFNNTAATELRMLASVNKTAVWPRLVYSDTIELNPPPAE